MISLSLNSCSTTWETDTAPIAKTYTTSQDQLTRSVGKLRRLLILPAVVKSKDCPNSPSDNELSKALYENTGKYLSDWKGYEVLYPIVKQDNEFDDLVVRLGTWQENNVGDGIPPEIDRETVIELAKKNTVDGVLLLHGKLSCLNAVDVTLYFMIIGIPNWANKLFGENVSAGIYEANSGRLVWKHYGSFLHPSAGGGVDASLWPSSLFDDIENAVPAVLSQ